ncbi:MAG: hypothetical protein ABI478_13720 [Propionivibrio sp.]
MITRNPDVPNYQLSSTLAAMKNGEIELGSARSTAPARLKQPLEHRVFGTPILVSRGRGVLQRDDA